MMKKHILIVDDNPTNLYMMETLLKGYGYEVTKAQNGREALEKARENPPDLVVTDILMPVMDGYNLCREWKADETLRHRPFAFYTATYTSSKNEDFALSLGADRLILKPQEPDVLIRIFRELLADGYRARQVEAKPLEEEMEFFRQYNEILFRKLEKKMQDLETANRKLRVSEECYRQTFMNASDVICTIDNNLNIQSISPSVERILGYEAQTFVGRPFSEFGHIVLTPESLERAIADAAAILGGQTIAAAVYEFITRDGTVKYGEVSGSPLMQQGRIGGIVSVARDITDRRRAEDALRQSEKRYQDLYNFLPIPVYEMDFEANITAANRAVFETFRGTEADLRKGANAWMILSPEDRERSARNIERLLKGERVEGTEYTLTRMDGTRFPAIVVSSVIYRDDKPVGLRGAVIDITERKKAEEDVQKLAAIVRHSGELINLATPDGKMTFLNEAGGKMLGIDPEAVNRYKIRDVLPEHILPKVQTDILPTLMSGGSWEGELQYRNIETGKLMDVYAMLFPIQNPAGGIPSVIANVSRDITDRKRAENQLRNALELLRKAYTATIQVMVQAVETRDPYTAGHQMRAAKLARAIALEMGLPRDKVEGIHMVGSIHDIGKMAVPAEILSKPTKLSDIEFSLVKAHAEKGYEILKDVESPWPLAEIVYQHHERMNGSGYPRSLTGEEILPEARILAVADVVEAMASHRPYRPGLGLNAALAEIENNKGRLYDGDVVDACLRLFREQGFELEGA
jgi:PAS domain S-box-containing protein